MCEHVAASTDPHWHSFAESRSRTKSDGPVTPGMDPVRRYSITNAIVVVAALSHALLTWPLPDVLALFVGGAAIAFALEIGAVAAGMVHHEMRPQVLGVPVVVIGAWPAIVYVTYRVALLALPEGVTAAVGAAALATALDGLTEPNATAEGVWSFPEHPLSSVRLAGIPAWNFLGWFVVVFVTALLPTVAG